VGRNTTTNISARRTLFGSDGFYAVARLGVLALVFAVSGSLTQASLWQPFVKPEPVVLLILAYGLVTVVVIVALAFRKRQIARAALVLDLVFLSLLTFFNQSPHDLFYPLFVLPLVGAALQMNRTTSMLVGILAAMAYGVAFLLSYATDAIRSVGSDTVGQVALALRCAVMVFIPWLVAGMAERWSAANRQTVALAEEQRLYALSEAQSYRARAHALYEVAYALSIDPNSQHILDTTLSEGRKLLEYTSGVVLLATGENDQLFVAASLGLAGDEQRQRVTLGQGDISAAIREVEPFLIEDFGVEPVFAPLPSIAGSRAALAIPLRSGLQRYGVLVIAADSADHFSQDRVEMLGALANYALVALQNAKLINDLRSERTKLLTKEEEVRHQLARDLHDGPAQALAAITMNVEFVKRLLERDPARVVPELDKLSALARRTTHEVRTMLFELRPLVLETQGLGETLRQYLVRFQDSTTQVILEADNLNVTLDTRTEGTLFNIIQESVNNALKHARATHIWVRVAQRGNLVETIIQDDGRGFDLQKVKESYDKRGSFGLLNIEERAQLVGGSAEIRSMPGEGTTIRVLVPVAA
jgi:signal transduction histidine kinase